MDMDRIEWDIDFDDDDDAAALDDALDAIAEYEREQHLDAPQLSSLGLDAAALIQD